MSENDIFFGGKVAVVAIAFAEQGLKPWLVEAADALNVRCRGGQRNQWCRAQRASRKSSRKCVTINVTIIPDVSGPA